VQRLVEPGFLFLRGKNPIHKHFMHAYIFKLKPNYCQ
jgi:hypothetical protein